MDEMTSQKIRDDIKEKYGLVFDEKDLEDKINGIDLIQNFCIDTKNITKNLENIKDSIDFSFISYERKEELKSKLNVFGRMFQREHRYEVFLPVSETKFYLNIYYYILIRIAEIYDRTGDEQLIPMIKDLLNIGLETHAGSDRKQQYYCSFYSPIVLNNLNKIYEGIREFYKLLRNDRDGNISEATAYMYKGIIVSKIQRALRWYSPGDNSELYLTALPARPHDAIENFSPYIYSKKLSACNSYEGVGELRTAEKIVKDAKKFFVNNQDKKEFRVALLGDINRSVGFMAEYVDFCLTNELENYYQDKAIQYSIFTKNKNLMGEFDSIYEDASEKAERPFKLADDDDEKQGKAYLTINYNLDQLFVNSKKMDKLIEDNDLIFMLDCKALYMKPYVDEIDSPRLLFTAYLRNEYDRYDQWAETSANIFVKNPLDDIYENLVTLCTFGKVGTIKKKVNEYLLRYCEKKWKIQEIRHCIFTYRILNVLTSCTV